jgi:Inosine-uridine nucleoside N-ribohydrolase
VAIVLALQSVSVKVAALTTVFGNTNLDQVTRNARYVLELCQSQARLYRGAEHSLDERVRRRDAVHGHDGLGDLGLLPRRQGADAGVAADQLIHLSGAHR